MAKFPALMLWTDAYLADTTHLNTLQHGAYLLLLMTAWRRPDCSLPDNDEFLAKVVGQRPNNWKRWLRPWLEPFFTVSDGKWTQKRLKREREHAERVSQRRSDNAKTRYQTGVSPVDQSPDNPLKTNDTTPANAGGLHCYPTTTTTQALEEEKTPPPSAPPSPPQEPPQPPEQPAAKPRAKRSDNGSYIPDDWEPSEYDRQYARARGLTDLEIAHTAEEFRLFWTSASGQRARKRNWSAAWQKRILELPNFGLVSAGRSGGDQGGGGSNGRTGSRPAGRMADTVAVLRRRGSLGRSPLH